MTHAHAHYWIGIGDKSHGVETFRCKICGGEKVFPLNLGEYTNMKYVTVVKCESCNVSMPGKIAVNKKHYYLCPRCNEALSDKAGDHKADLR